MTLENEAVPFMVDDGCGECDALGKPFTPTTSACSCEYGEADRSIERKIRAYGGEAARRMALGDSEGARLMFKIMATAIAARSPEQVTRLERARGLR